MDFVLSEKAMQEIDRVLDEDLLRAGASSVLLVDRSGYLIANRGDPNQLDVVALAALSAANYGVTEEIARLVSYRACDRCAESSARVNSRALAIALAN